VALAAIAWSSAGAQTTAWKVSIAGQPKTANQAIEWYAKEVTARTGGQLKLDLAYNDTKPAEAADLIKSGARHAAYICAAYFTDKMPLTTVLDLPLLPPDNMAALGQVELALGDHPAIRAELARSNIRMLLPVPRGQLQLIGTRRISKVEDLKGARVRITPESGKILEEYGATSKMMSGAQGAAALKTGELDTVSFSDAGGFAGLNVEQTAKYLTDNISLGTQLCFIGVSVKAWDALPAKTQKIVLDLRQPALAQMEKLHAQETEVQYAIFKKAGIEFVQLGSTDRARLVARAVKVWNAWVEEREKQGLKGRDVFEFTQKKIREASAK
jgi:TRAP-type C4-dicarboxylate transport system substrate-binding protein